MLCILHFATLRCDPFGMPAAARVVILKLSARRNVFFYEPAYGVSLKGMWKQLQFSLTNSRQVDIITAMEERQKSTHIKPRQIVGFSLSPELAAEVKMEAARQGLSLKHLFEKLWAQYKKEQEKTERDAHKS